MKFTQAAVERFQMPAGKTEHIEFDEAMPGFGLRIRDGGSRTFIAQYKIGAKHRRMSLGNAAKVTLDNARREAKKIFGKVVTGLDPANEKTVARKEASHTFGATVPLYLKAREPELKPRSYQEIKRHLEALWKPLHGMALASIKRAHVAAQVRVIAGANGPVAANRARSTLSAFFAWCIGEGLIDENPVIGTNKQKENKERDRALTDQEAATVWDASPENDYGRILRLLLLTLCRRSEIGGLRWSDFDADARTIVIPPEATKNGLAHLVPLPDMAFDILNKIPRREGRDLIFGEGKGGFSGWSKSKERLDATLKIAAWTLHDLRRTGRTGVEALGVPPHIGEALLNHVQPKLKRTYNLYDYKAEKKAALDLWASHLAVVLAQATGTNVASLHSRRASGQGALK